MRVFAVDNVSDVAVTPQTFEKPADFNLEAYGAHSVSGVVHGESVADVTVRFSPVVAKAATAASTVARDRRVVRRDDGGVDITYRVADPLEIVRFSLGWGAEAEIVAPEEARAGRRRHRAAARRAIRVAGTGGRRGAFSLRMRTDAIVRDRSWPPSRRWRAPARRAPPCRPGSPSTGSAATGWKAPCCTSTSTSRSATTASP